jgi:hypothetical protein
VQIYEIADLNILSKILGRDENRRFSGYTLFSNSILFAKNKKGRSISDEPIA